MFTQSRFELKCEWGVQGIQSLASDADVIVIVDVLSFCTAADIAVGRGAVIYPYRYRDETAEAFARLVGAEIASGRSGSGYSLSPQSLAKIPVGTKVVLPSPNGATLMHHAGSTPALAGCLRNAKAVATAAQQCGKRIAVIPAGERWPDGSLRPAFEDLIGAGAVLSHLTGNASPDAIAAVAAFQAASPNLEAMLKQCGSGVELIERGFEKDVELAAALDVSACVPVIELPDRPEEGIRLVAWSSR